MQTLHQQKTLSSLLKLHNLCPGRENNFLFPNSRILFPHHTFFQAAKLGKICLHNTGTLLPLQCRLFSSDSQRCEQLQLVCTQTSSFLQVYTRKHCVRNIVSCYISGMDISGKQTKFYCCPTG